MTLPAPFAVLRIHPDDGVTVSADETRKPGSVAVRVYSEEQIKTIIEEAVKIALDRYEKERQ